MDNYIQQALNEFNKRQSLLDNHLLTELAAIVVSFAVSKDQLFEEALLGRHIPLQGCNIENLLSQLTDAKHALTEAYINKLWDTDMSSDHIPMGAVLSIKLKSAMTVGWFNDLCHRLSCFYRSGGCTCLRPVLAHNLSRRIVMPF